MRTPEVEAAMAWAVLAYNGDTIGEAAAELLRSLATPDIDQFSDDNERLHDGALRTLAAEVERLEAQNARLRAALEDVSLLAHCISKAGPLNTPDLETAWRKFDLISVKAAEALVDRKAVLNDEEASK